MDLDLIKDLTILYVEDEPEVLSQTAIILKDFVKDVLTAKNGVEALEKLAANPSIDLVITDIMMPEMNGLDMVRQIRTSMPKCQDIPVVMATAYSDLEYLLEAISLKVDGYVVKPLNVKELINKIYAIMIPVMEKRKIPGCYEAVETLTQIVGGKKIEIIKHVLDNVDEDNIFKGSYQDIMDALEVSKPTVVNLFKSLIDAGVLDKIRNKVYRLNRTEMLRSKKK